MDYSITGVTRLSRISHRHTAIPFAGYSRSQNYRAHVIMLAVFSSLIADFYHPMIFISNIKPKDHDLTIFIS